MNKNLNEDENFDVLQNIEFAIVSALENHPDMDDSDVMGEFGTQYYFPLGYVVRYSYRYYPSYSGMMKP